MAKKKPVGPEEGQTQATTDEVMLHQEIEEKEEELKELEQKNFEEDQAEAEPAPGVYVEEVPVQDVGYIVGNPEDGNEEDPLPLPTNEGDTPEEQVKRQKERAEKGPDATRDPGNVERGADEPTKIGDPIPEVNPSQQTTSTFQLPPDAPIRDNGQKEAPATLDSPYRYQTQNL